MEITNGAQLRRALLEDNLVDLILKHYGDFVMHGGTAIWRCYGGNRFSRDVDFYSNLEPSAESSFQKRFHKLLVDSGYPIREEKYNNRTKTLHVILRGLDTTGKLDITFVAVKGAVAEYTRVDGSKRIIHALGPEALINEKMDAYISKYEVGEHEAQDLYDMCILKDRLGKPSNTTLRRLSEFLAKVGEAPPKDERVLKQLVLSGGAPDFKGMIGLLQGWLDDAGK